MSNFMDKKGCRFTHVKSQSKDIFAYKVNRNLSDWQYTPSTRSYRLRQDSHWNLNKRRTKVNEQ